MHPLSRIRLAFFLVLIGGIALGCKREAPPEAPPEEAKAEHVGPFTTAQTPDGQPFVVTFPGKPEWTDVPDLKLPTKGFVWNGSGKYERYAAWVWVIPPEERANRSAQELGLEYAKKAANVWNNAYFFYGQDPRGAGRGGWQSKAATARDVRPEAKDSGAGTVLVVGDKAYCLRIWGSELALTDPECQAFLLSLKIPELENRPAAKAPDDDLRPLAKDGDFSHNRGPTQSTGIAILPGRKAAFRATFAYTKTLEFDPDGYKLTRYHYPSFQREGDYTTPPVLSQRANPDPQPKIKLGIYATPTLTYIVGSDDKRNRLYLFVGPTAKEPRKLIRFDVPEKFDKETQDILKEAKALDLQEDLGSLHAAPDGKTLYGMSSDRSERKWLVRFDAEEMKQTGSVALATKTRSLCLSPDGKTLYTGAEESVNNGPLGTETNCLVQEFDAATLKPRRKFTVRSDARTMTCGADGRLYLAQSWLWTRVDPTGQGEPKVQKVTNNDVYESFILSPDAKRLYATRDGRHPYSLDTQELFDHGRFVIAPKSMQSGQTRLSGLPPGLSGSLGPSGPPGQPGQKPPEEPNRFSVNGIISPDGKCLWLDSGHIFWLAGAGPLPEVDPAKKWQP